MTKPKPNQPTGKRYACYFRCSTKRQGESGLGLDAQRKMVAEFITANGGVAVAEFVEVESGKKNDRPQMAAALERCKKEGLTLLVAKLDRLARNVFFIASLQNAKVDFVAVENPSMTPFVINILAAVAENEANAIAGRVVAALEQCKLRGVKLGNPRWSESVEVARKAKSAKASARNAHLLAIIEEIKTKTGLKTYKDIANALNLRGIRTARGCEFSAASVHQLSKSED